VQHDPRALLAHWKDSVGRHNLPPSHSWRSNPCRNEVWPDAKFPALGAFMFLRFISPTVVSPESIDIELPKENESTMRRGLMVVAKVIQNLANNMFFGKQAHMAPLNDFLKENIVVVTRFLSELNVCITSSLLPLDLF
jgi:hypothetical protein